MAITFDNTGRPTYMFQAGATSTDGVWYAVGAKVDTAAGYEWAGAQTFLNTVTTDATVNMLDGFNNFLNPAARDAAIPSPAHGTIAFVRQDAGGSPLNQIQFYNGTAWVANDGDISGVTAGAGLTGGGTAGTISLAVDTTVVATTSNTLTMSGKTLSAATLTGTLTAGGSVGTNGYYLQTTGSGVTWAAVDALPSQSGNTGKYLTTNGTAASWASIVTDPSPTMFMLMGA